MWNKSRSLRAIVKTLSTWSKLVIFWRTSSLSWSQQWLIVISKSGVSPRKPLSWYANWWGANLMLSTIYSRSSLSDWQALINRHKARPSDAWSSPSSRILSTKISNWEAVLMHRLTMDKVKFKRRKTWKTTMTMMLTSSRMMMIMRKIQIRISCHQMIHHSSNSSPRLLESFPFSLKIRTRGTSWRDQCSNS